MSAQNTPDQSFPAPCKRCGGALYQHADLCPYCGASHPLATPAPCALCGCGWPAAPSAAGGHPTQAGHAATRFTEYTGSSTRSCAGRVPPVGSRGLLTRGLIVLGVVILGYGGYTLLGDHHTSTPAYDEQDTQSTAGSIAPYTPDQTTNTRASTGAINPSAVPTPAVARRSSSRTIEICPKACAQRIRTRTPMTCRAHKRR